MRMHAHRAIHAFVFFGKRHDAAACFQIASSQDGSA